MGSTTPKPHQQDFSLRGHAGIIPMRIATILALGLTLSLFFIITISFAFMGEDGDEPYFKGILTEVAQASPGIVLLGQNVDIDVDEPSITLRWSIHGCGEEFVLPNSVGIGGSPACGLPAMPLRIFVDSNIVPGITYEPDQLPFVLSTGKRRNVQNLVQFDSDHILDAHEARLYPFDTYLLTTTLRAVNALNETVPIQKVAAIDQTASFVVATTDVASYSALSNGTQLSSRDVDFLVKRPGQARAYTLLLFSISWMLAHMTIGLVAIMWYSELTTLTVVKFLALAFGALLAIPQFRNTMPDAPGFDGFLIDTIGFFPQMIFSGISIIALLLSLISREFHLGSHRPNSEPILPLSPPPFKGSHQIARYRDRPSVGRSTSSIHMAQNDLARLIKHLNGEFAFPKVIPSSQVHRRNRSSRFEQSHSHWRSRESIMPHDGDRKFV